MTIEQFLRGCFDCGYEAAVMLHPSGVWRISVYEGSDVFTSRYRKAEGSTFAAALETYTTEPWEPSAKDAIAAAQALGGWK